MNAQSRGIWITKSTLCTYSKKSHQEWGHRLSLEKPPFLIVAICQNSREPPADYMCHERCLQAETVFRICKATNEENDKHNL